MKKPAAVVDEELYKEWIDFLFDRPQYTGKDTWYWDIHLKEISASPEQKVMLIGATFERCGKDLQEYSDIQIVNGLNYIFNNAISNDIYLIMQKGVDEELRIDAVLKMKHLYRDCFAHRCNPVLSNIDEAGANPLNKFCYMLWDTSPLSSWKDVVLDVMEDALYIPNDACIESALHGLGHRAMRQDKERVPAIIDKFLSKTKRLRGELRQYALQARTGNIL